MIKKLFYKWFGLVDEPCPTCEILREQLVKCQNERSELLHRLVDPKVPQQVEEKEEEFRPVTPQFIPWRLRQQMLEAEDHKRAELTRAKEKEIHELEKQLGIPQEK